MGQVYIKDMRLRAFHGVLEQERTVGNDYVINISVDYSVEKAMKSDDVNDTLNYATLADIIKTEMAQPSRLLEHVAGRIVKSINTRFPSAKGITLDIRKVAPPISSLDCDGAGVRVIVHNS